MKKRIFAALMSLVVVAGLMLPLAPKAKAVGIDIETIRIIVDHISFRSQCIKYTFSNGGCTSVGAIQTNPHSFKGTGWQGNQITDITVSS